MKNYAALTLMMVTLSGCSSMFETGDEPTKCPVSNDPGLPCTTTRDIMKLTDSPDGIKKEKAKRIAAAEGQDDDTEQARANTNSSGYGANINLREVSNEYQFRADLNRALPAPEPIAVRQQPRMLRVAFAPWQDENGRLQNIGYVYSEIEEKKYTFGREAFNMPAQITPLYIRQSSMVQERANNPNGINGVGIKTEDRSKQAMAAALDAAPDAIKKALKK